MTILFIITAGSVIAAMLAILWPGSPLKRPHPGLAPGGSFFKMRLTRTDMVFQALLVVALLAGLIAPLVAPESTFALWLRRERALLPYWGACTLVAGAARVLFGLAVILKDEGSRR